MHAVNGEDLAGNNLAPIDPGISLFEILYRSSFEVKFFSNPVDNEDLIFVIKGFISMEDELLKYQILHL